MGRLSPEKMTHELQDIIIHRECVLRSGTILAEELKKQGKGGYSTALLLRCFEHDMSKLQNLSEFLSLASIVHHLDEMSDVGHQLSDYEKMAISEHQKNNKHHPEYYENPNDMSRLDIMEQVADCHARGKQFKSDSVSEFFKKNVGTRWAFDEQHQMWIRQYSEILDDLTRGDFYRDIVEQHYDLGFNFTDRTVELLENFDATPFVDYLYTDRLYLKLNRKSDFATTTYEIHLKDINTQIGFVDLTYSGELMFKIYENYKGLGYLREAMSKLIETANMDNFFIYIQKNNAQAIDCIQSLGFVIDDTHVSDSTFKFRYTKPNKIWVPNEKTLSLSHIISPRDI